MSEKTRKTIAFVMMGLGALVTAALVAAIPAEAVLGSKIKLPIFHGALTWVNLAAFTLMGLAALVYLISRSPAVYRWEAGLRTVSAPLWLIGSALGFISAMNTWDFSASKERPAALVMQDPRLMAQFYLLLGAGALLAAQLLLETRVLKAIGDLVFVAAMWYLISDLFIDPSKRALHPDSPVLNSDDIAIKLTFFGIVAGLLTIVLALAWLAGRRAKATDGDGDEGTPTQVATASQ